MKYFSTLADMFMKGAMQADIFSFKKKYFIIAFVLFYHFCTTLDLLHLTVTVSVWDNTVLSYFAFIL